MPVDVYDIAGFRAGVSAEPPDVHMALRAVMRGFGPLNDRPSSALLQFDVVPAGSLWHVRRDGVTVQVDATAENAIGSLEWHVVAAALDHRPDLFHLHGGALKVPADERGLVLVGRAGSGKTTTTLGLMTRGFLPFGDDVTLIDPANLCLQPLRRAFHVNDTTRELVAPHAGGRVLWESDGPPGYVSPITWAAQPVTPAWLLVVERRPGTKPELARIDPAQAAAAVLQHSISLTRSSRRALATTARLVQDAKCYRFFTGDLSESLDAVERLVSRDGPN